MTARVRRSTPVSASPLATVQEDDAARVAARFRACFEQSPLAQVLVGLDGRVTAVNPVFCALVGRERAALVGCDLCDLLHLEQPGARGHLSGLLAGGADAERFERQLVDAQGRPLPVLVDAVLMRDEQGRPLEASLVLQDLRSLREVERRREQQEDFFLALSQRATDLALVADAEGRIVYASPAVQHVLGHDAADLVSLEGWDFVHPDDLEATRAVFAAVVDQGGTDTSTLRVRDGYGGWRWVEGTATNLLGTAVGGVVCNLRDVTERVVAEQALRASEARYRAIAETAEEGILAVAPDGRTLYANARLAAILGVPVGDLYARCVIELLDAEQAAEMVSRLAGRDRRGTERFEVAYAHPDGGVRHLRVASSPLPGPDGEHSGSLGMVSDVTETRRVEEELRRAALHDALTGLPNRALLLDRLEQVLTRQASTDAPSGAAVLMLDLDHFKLVNDSRGHGVGDSLLVAVAERLRGGARPVDTVARFGGDEFAVVCEDVDQVRARELAEDLLETLREPFLVDGHVLHVNASLGVAVTPVASGDDLLRFADAALHTAKAAGRGVVALFDPSHADEAEHRYALAADLRAALEEDRLRLHYQPVVALETGRVLAVEALARWRHPELGEVPPARFVQVAEQAGLAVQLDGWAFERAVRETAELRTRGVLEPDVTVAVNLSARTLVAPLLEEGLLRAVEATGTPPHLVVLEITESAVMQDAEQSVRVLERLRARGFRVAVDDFGTGYSSLAYLRDLPITSIKVDRSFVAGIVEDRDALAIVASIVDLARAIDVQVVAEGVETPEQAALLRRLGCVTAQGWLWSPALAPEQVEEVAATWRAGYPTGSARPARVAQKQTERWNVLPEHGGDRLLELHRQGASLTTIAAALNGEGYRTPSGARWHRTTVARTVTQAAYPELSTAERPTA